MVCTWLKKKLWLQNNFGSQKNWTAKIFSWEFLGSTKTFFFVKIIWLKTFGDPEHFKFEICGIKSILGSVFCTLSYTHFGWSFDFHLYLAIISLLVFPNLSSLFWPSLTVFLVRVWYKHVFGLYSIRLITFDLDVKLYPAYLILSQGGGCLKNLILKKTQSLTVTWT